MKRSLWYLIGLIVIIAIVLGVYFGFHKSNKNTPYSSTGSSNSTGSNNNPNQSTSSNVVLTKNSSTLGDYLTDPTGKPLYTYNGDTSGVSNCTGSCLTSWPPYVASGTPKTQSGVSTIKRTDDGQMQYTYNGLPLYYFTGDSNSTPTGNGVSNFTLAKPTSQTGASNTSNSSNSSGSGYPY